MGADDDRTRDPHANPPPGGSSPPEDAAPSYDSDGWNRLIAVGPGDLPNRISSDAYRRRAILMLWVAADHLPDRKRRAAAERLVDEVFSRPLHDARFAAVRRRGIEREAIRRAAVDFLIEGVWRERGCATYDDLVDGLFSHLNDRVTVALLGPAWRRQTETRANRAREGLSEPRDVSERAGLRRWHDRRRRSRRSPCEMRDAIDRRLDDEERALFAALRRTEGNVSESARRLDWPRWRAQEVVERIREKAATVV